MHAPMHTQDAVHTLDMLIETCDIGVYGFRTAAEHAHSQQLRSLFSRRADECALASAELLTKFVLLGGDPASGGPSDRALLRGWATLLGMLASDSDQIMIEACERGDDSALQTYREALDRPLPDDLRQLIEDQFERVERNHAEARRLRDRVRALSS